MALPRDFDDAVHQQQVSIGNTRVTAMFVELELGAQAFCHRTGAKFFQLRAGEKRFTSGRGQRRATKLLTTGQINLHFQDAGQLLQRSPLQAQKLAVHGVGLLRVFAQIFAAAGC